MSQYVLSLSPCICVKFLYNIHSKIQSRNDKNITFLTLPSYISKHRYFCTIAHFLFYVFPERRKIKKATAQNSCSGHIAFSTLFSLFQRHFFFLIFLTSHDIIKKRFRKETKTSLIHTYIF